MPPKTQTNPYALPRRTSPQRPSPTQKQATPGSSRRSSNAGLRSSRGRTTPRVTGKPAPVGRQTKHGPSAVQDHNVAGKGKGAKGSNNRLNSSNSKEGSNTRLNASNAVSPPATHSPESNRAGPLFMEEDLDDLNGGDQGNGGNDDDDDDEDYNANFHENDDPDNDENKENEESEDNNDEESNNNRSATESELGLPPKPLINHTSAAAAAAAGSVSALTAHLSGERLRFFNELAATAGLNEEYKVMGRVLCNVDGRADHFVSMTVALLSTRQEISDYHQETNAEATQCIIMGDVQAYTATADKEGNQEHLPRSLAAKLLDKILDNPSEWRKRLLPARYGRNPDPVESRDFQKWLNIILKEIRKDLNKIKTPSKLNVPTIETLIVKARVLFCMISLEISICMASIHWGWNTQSYSNRSFWGVVDEKLEELRSKSVRYRYAFFLEVLRQDFDRFDGEVTFAEIQKTTKFELPTENEVEAQIKHLEETHGARVVPAELAHNEPAG
ncbi:uncharacterized protein MELLADRAFT_87314 [Melampsora larici-populina 98AG31]|uniref:Uncharacterized protein n=1 Tax=Melampsora larici-populina (strain 98AG31 / pathotype 3-4-7) TaxID=747676 RepID=F4RMT6_MELLP|nr:uncharacterized protein MELLADRAFT_87314 [Melampsora larici-populina 98AG31]EGG06167.1 hypothetical protein MELLADRAFT_87314 [Melampsora larici-populina 98AG31]